MKSSIVNRFASTCLTALLFSVLCMASASRAAAQCGTDPGNDNEASNTPFGTCGTVSAAIDCETDVDVYSFQAPMGGDYTFSSDAMFGTIVSVGYGSGWINNFSNTWTETLGNGEWIYVKVEASIPGQIFDYDLTISGCDSACGDDPGDNDFDSATRFDGCTTITSALDCTDDHDFYWFAPFQEGTHVIETLGGTDTRMRLYDNSRTEIASDDDGGADRNAMISQYLQANQVYYVEIWEYSNGTGVYELRINCPGGGNCGDDPADDHPAYATPLAGCGAQQAAIQCASDVDHYRFTAPADSSYTFSVGASYTMNLTLLDGLGAQILSSGQDSLVWSLNQGEDVILKVEDAGTSWSYDYILEVTGCDSSCGNDPGNDYLASATPLDGCGSTPAAVDCVGDVDFYWLEAPISGEFVIDTTGDTDTELRLYDHNGDVIATDNDSGQGHNARIIHTLSAGQRYSVAVNESLDDATGDYTLEIIGCDQGGCGNDPGNDTRADATDLGDDCGTTDAAFDCLDDVDFYRFTATSDSEYVFETNGDMDTMMEILDDEGSSLATDDDGGQGYNSRIALNLTQGETYFIRINEYQGNDTGGYSLSISGCGGGPCGNDPGNDTIGDATNLDTCGTTSAAIDCPGDLDYYGFVPPDTNGGDFIIETTGDLDTELRLYDANGDVVTTDDNSGEGSNARIVFALAYGSRYYVAVNENGYDGNGNYELVISGCEASGCGNDPGDDTRATATDLGSSCGLSDAAFDCVDDVDFYRFTAPNDGIFVFETSGSSDTMMELQDDEGSVLSSDDDGGQDRCSRIEYQLVQGETYYIRINEYQGNDTGNYGLEISGCGATGEPPVGFRYVVAATAKVSGAAGTNWVSDLSVLNLGEQVATVIISLWERDRANLNPQQSTVTLAAGEMLRSVDVLLDRFAVTSGAAALELQSDEPLAIGSRTYNTVDSRTYGQFIPGEHVAKSFAAGELVVLSGITENQNARTNMGLVNPGLDDIQITGHFFDALGSSLGVRSWTVPAQGYIQRNRILREVIADDSSGAWVQLSADTGSFFAFVSVVDEQSGDPVYRPAQHRPDLLGEVVMPGVAKVAGAAGTNWVTDAIFTNTSEQAASVQVSLWNRDGDNSTPEERSMVIQAGQAVESTDVMLSLFGRSSGAAALQIVAEPGLLVDGRTYNLVTAGTYGQYIPALTGERAVTHQRKGFLVMSAENTASRTNLGFVNLSDQTTDVQVRLFDIHGMQVGAPAEWTLGPQAVVQYNRILSFFTTQAVDAGWLEVSVSAATPDGRVQVFNSVVDQVSGDPIFETVTLEP